MTPERYRNLSGDSGVTSYATGADFIAVQFKTSEVYVYDYVTPGREHVERMKALAESGRGLSTYIAQHVSRTYARKQSSW